MKKVLLIIFSLLVAFSLVGCSFISHKDIIEKDEKGREIKSTHFGDNGKLLYTLCTEYDDSNGSRTVTTYNSSNNFEHKYKYEYQDGTLYKSTQLDINDNVVYYIIFEYWSNGNRKCETEYDGDTNRINEISVFDEETGHITKKTTYQNDGTIEEVEEWNQNTHIVYDSSGKKVKEEIYNR